MPPRRTRAATATKDPAPKKRTKREPKLPESLPQRPQTDTYTPPSTLTTQTRDVLKNLILKKKDAVSGSLQVKISMSLTEAAIIANNQETIQQSSGAVLVVSEPVEGSVDRDVICTGKHKQVVEALSLVSLTLEEAVSTPLSVDEQCLHTTLLLQSSHLTSVKWIIDEPSIDISDELVPFSTFKSVYISATATKFISLIFDLFKSLSQSSHESTAALAPSTKIPITGSRLPLTQRTEENQSLLNKSKIAFTRYLNEEPEEPQAQPNKDITTTKLNEDPLATSQSQIQQAIQQCQLKLKSNENFRSIIDVPVDQVSGVIGKGGSKINEIRARSNCNVNIDDNIKNGVFRALTIIGNAEGQLIALQYLGVLIQ